MSISQIVEDLTSTYDLPRKIDLNGKLSLTIPEVVAVSHVFAKVNIKLSLAHKQQIEKVCQKILEQVESGISIYGTSTSFGGQAGLVVNKGERSKRLKRAERLAYSIIHVDVSTGPAVPVEIVRSAMLIRINMLLTGISGIRLSTLEQIKTLLNKNVTPLVGRYGSVGASGDLAQNGRIVSALLQMPNTKVFSGKNLIKTDAKKALTNIGLKPIELYPKEGLALVNGDNFSSAWALEIAFQTAKLMLINSVVSSLTIQSLKGSTRNFHPILHQYRRHEGQKFASELYLKLLKDSKLARQELKGYEGREDGELVQDPYSLRCLPQFYGHDWEMLGKIWETIKININSVSDNPVWTLPRSTTPGERPYQWVTGGNFMAMHMSESLDSLRKILVHMVKQNDRHLSRLVNPKFNRDLPANLSDKTSISQAVFKGLQTQMGMFDVYSSLLVHPASTAFGIAEENNQDITSHAPSSAILAWELLRLTKLAVATNFISACQAIDLRGGPDLLSPSTRPFYDWLRKKVPYIKEEQPLGHYVEEVAENLVGLKELYKII